MFPGSGHSVPNTVLFTIIGLREGIDVALAAGAVTIALLGSFVGGGCSSACTTRAYANDDTRNPRHR